MRYAGGIMKVFITCFGGNYMTRYVLKKILQGKGCLDKEYLLKKTVALPLKWEILFILKYSEIKVCKAKHYEILFIICLRS